MSGQWRVPILTYHGLHAPGWDYASNDHVALAQDLEVLASMDIRVIPLTDLVTRLCDAPDPGPMPGPLAALSFDDGTELDYVDFYHPDYGHLKSLDRVLREGPAIGWQGGPARATSFVIASPAARAALDRACIAGRGQWGDAWWVRAAAGGQLDIANHSWDHNHAALDAVALGPDQQGRFDGITDYEAADTAILQAERFIRERTGGQSVALFAYPYGQCNEFLENDYFPARREWFAAAFTTAGRTARRGQSRWALPRFVCGEHWDHPDGLREILSTVCH